MPNTVFDGISDAVFGSFKETVQAVLTMLPPPLSPPFTQTVDCIFHETDTDMKLGTRPNFGGSGFEFANVRPMAFIKTADTDPAPKFGDHLLVAGNNYKVTEVFFDGLQANQLTLIKL